MDEPSDELLDAYLDRALRGESLDPDELLEEHVLDEQERAGRNALAGALRVGGGDLPGGAPPVPSAEAAAPERQPDPPRGHAFGNYEIARELGRGGQGIVYLATDLRLRRKVALKVLNGPASGGPTDSPSAQATARLRREAEVASRLDHSGICAVYEIGTEQQRPYIAMRYVEGETLARKIETARASGETCLDPEEISRELGGASDPPREHGQTTSRGARQRALVGCLQLIEHVARALHVAHEANVLHRDIKPANIIITPLGEPVVLDFGLARDQDVGATLTASGAFLGSPAYMSPEQVASKASQLDRRTDVYSLGVVLYECLTLRRPFESASREGLYQAILTQPPPNPRKRNPAIGHELLAVLERALEKQRERRYATALDLAEDLRRLRVHEPVLARRAGPLLRAQRWLQRNPWRGAAACALVVAMSTLVYMWSDVRQKRLRGHLDRAYDANMQSSPGLEAFQRAVLGAESIDPRHGEVRDLREALDLRMAEIEAQTAWDEALTGLQTCGKLREEPGALQPLDGAASAAPKGPDEEPAPSPSYERTYNDALLKLNLAVTLNSSRIDIDARFEDFGNERRLAMHAGAPAPSITAAALAAALAKGNGFLYPTGKPEEAEAYLFAYRSLDELEPARERRLVPVPLAPNSTRAATSDSPPDLLSSAGQEVVCVLGVEPESPADRAGLRAGDLIESVAGFPVARAVAGSPAERTLFALAGQQGGSPVGAIVPPFARLVSLRGMPVQDEYALQVAQCELSQGARCAAQFEFAGSTLDIELQRTATGWSVPIGAAVQALTGQLADLDIALSVVSGGERRDAHLVGPGSSGLRAVATSTPLAFLPRNAHGTLATLGPIELAEGSYLLVVRHEGFEDLRLPVRVRAGEIELARVELLPASTTPEGFAYVPAGPYLRGGDAQTNSGPLAVGWLDGYWIRRTEVTSGEYEQFLNDAATAPDVREGERTRSYLRVPREFVVYRLGRPPCRPLWEKLSDGKYRSPWDPDIPIHHIACEDADAYCRWLTLKGQERGDRWIFRLPTENEWEKAARGADGRFYPWGDEWDVSFCKNKFVRPEQDECRIWEPVLRFSRDESPYGVRDLAGGAFEYCVGEAPSTVAFRRPWRGGTARSGRVEARCALRSEGYPMIPGENDGIRVVAWKPVQR